MGKLYYQGPNGDILVSKSSIPNLKKDKTLAEVVKDDIKENSETMFKTINGESIIGEGNIVIEGGSGEGIPSPQDLLFVGLNLDETSLEILGITEKLDQLEETKNYNEYHCEVKLNIVSGEAVSFFKQGSCYSSC